ncbi:MAG TPA: hypothetical protein VGB60_04455 [Brevundimonas sp.]|jgi:hypothetical protein|uniref:hypothetical protein n=1 Tax=Brevundimonas sp. TaxID=1871086 RepID=UPI002EDB0552
MSDRPLSDLVRQGWTVVAYSATDMSGETYQHNVLLTRQGQHRILTLRKKMLGDGLVATEMEV